MGRGAGNAPVPRFGRAFSGMDVAINHLKFEQSPKIDQSRPGRVSVFAPDPEQRDAMVDFGIPPQPPAALCAAPILDAPQQLDLAAGHIPELLGPVFQRSNMPAQSDRPVGRTRGKIPGPVRARLHGVDGTKGRARARASTTRGNTGGKALVRRTSYRRFLSAFSSSQPDIVRLCPAEASCDRTCE